MWIWKPLSGGGGRMQNSSPGKPVSSPHSSLVTEWPIGGSVIGSIMFGFIGSIIDVPGSLGAPAAPPAGAVGVVDGWSPLPLGIVIGFDGWAPPVLGLEVDGMLPAFTPPV